MRKSVYHHRAGFMIKKRVGCVRTPVMRLDVRKIAHEVKGIIEKFDYVSVGGNLQSNIKVLDMSHNNISDIMRFYFRPVEYSLTHLYLAHNEIANVTQGVFGNMPHLQWLDFRYNDLVEVDFDCFRNTKNLQVLLLSHNNMMDIPAEALRPLKKLRILDLSWNKLRTLPDNLFTEPTIESLDLSHNQFMRLPAKAMSPAAAGWLSTLDMSWNLLSGIHNTDAISKLHVSRQNRWNILMKKNNKNLD